MAGFALALLVAANSRGQESSGDSASLARYVPKDNLILYFEYEGLDAHADAWKKTAACKILNDTPAGVMFEEVVAQVLDKFSDKVGKGRKAGSELVTLAKHVARSGFVFAMVANPQDQAKPSGILVIRNAFKDKAVRAIMARNLQEMNAPNSKPQQVVRAGHKVVSGINTRGSGYAWWVDDSKKEDIVQVYPGAEAADVFLETLDGKRLNAIGHPRRVELSKAENGFIPTGFGFAEPILFNSPKIPASLGLSDLKKLDFRWGFHDDALMTVTRVSAASPRKGLLALLDGPTFDKGKLPPVPESVTGFTVLSLDLKTAMEKLVALARPFSPDVEDKVKAAVDLVKARTKLRLKEDILAHLGPKVAWYVLPSKSSAPPSLPGSSMISMMMAGAGMDQIPKLAVVFDIDDPVAFGKVLDEVMAGANREFKAQANKAPGDAPQPKPGRGRGPSVPSVEFRSMSGDTKMFVLQVPPELAGQFPASFRPSIRVGPKHVALAVSPDVARLALETKGSWAPPSGLNAAFQGLSSKSKVLTLSDPRETLPGIMASFPGKLQSGINAAILLKSGATPPPVVPTPGRPGVPTVGGPGRAADSASPADAQLAARQVMGNPGGSRAPGVPGAPGAASPSGGAATFVLKIDASKVPSADSIKALLFPSIFAVEVDDDEIRITTREAFPSLPDPSKVGAISSVVPMLMPKGGLPLGMTPPPGSPSQPGTGPAPARPGAGGGAGNNPN